MDEQASSDIDAYPTTLVQLLYSGIYGRLENPIATERLEHLAISKEHGEDTIQQMTRQMSAPRRRDEKTHGLVKMMSDAPSTQRVVRELQ